MWTVIHNFIRIMPQKYRDAYDEYVVTVIGNRTSQRWEECLDRMQPVFGMPLGLLFVDETFDEGSKEKVRSEVNNGIQSKFRLEEVLSHDAFSNSRCAGTTCMYEFEYSRIQLFERKSVRYNADCYYGLKVFGTD